ncbi:MAG: 2-isopropylmalate synthase [Candidatus Bathyarchaeota archaeon]|nr:2-isopropylmalate synthase [Candidatus Bathyarchaeota archaeon]
MKFFDTTLRDGEQTPGVSLTPEKKLRIAESLDKIGVSAMEAGFAAASEGELDAIKLIAEAGLRADVYSMARGVTNDIDAVLKTGAKGVHLVIPSSDLHLQYKLKKTRAEVLKITENTTQYAKDHGLVVELSAEDATRSEIDFLAQMFKAGVDAGADRLCPCDTVGVLIPEQTAELYTQLKKRLPNVPLSVHCHDDFGLAVANSIIALQNGADQAHVTMNGLGERAGNASLEELAVVLKAQYKLELPIKTELIYETSRLVSRITDFPLQPNKSIVGENAFVHESGMHTHGILSNPSTYEPFKPEMIGRTRRIAAGKHSGSTGIRASLVEMGLEPTDGQVKEIFLRVKSIGDKGKRVADADLQAIAEVVMGLPPVRPITLEEITVVTGNKVTSTASVRLNLNGETLTEAATGVGPVDAAITAIKKAVGIVEPIQLENYSVKAITGGTNAVTEVAVRLSKGDRKATAAGVNEDIVIASVEAMISGMNVLMTNYNKNKK